MRAVTSSDMLIPSFIFLSADTLPFNPFSFGGSPNSSLPFPGGQLRVACRDLAGHPRLADLAGLTGIGRHGVKEESSGPLVLQAIYKYPCILCCWERKISHYPVDRVLSGVCWPGKVCVSWWWVLIHVINLRVKNDGGWFGYFFLHFPCFDFINIQRIFFKGKTEVLVSEINSEIQQFSFLPAMCLLCGMATTAAQLLPSTSAPQHLCSPDFPYSWPSLTKTSHRSRPQKRERSHYFIIFSCSCTREGCTSAARGCNTSAQEIPQSRNIYQCCRHWCSVLITAAWAGDQDTTHVLSLPSGN